MRKWNIVSLMNDDTGSYAVGTIINNQDFRNMIRFHYTSWKLPTGSYLEDWEEHEICETKQDAINFLRVLFNDWVGRRLPDFEKLKDLFEADYNPIENYDRYEEGTITDAKHYAHTESTTVTPDTTTKSVQRINGYDGGLVQAGENEVTQDGSTTSTTTYADDSNTNYDKNVRDFDNYHIHGNIGVTTTQQMMLQELDIRSKSDLQAYIVREFVNMFLIL